MSSNRTVSPVSRAAGFGALLVAVAMLLVSPPRLASQAAPANSKFLCKDGTHATAAHASDACARHGGVARPLSAPAAAPNPAPAPAPARAATPAPAPAPAVAPAPHPAAQPSGAFGLGVGYESFATSYWFYGGGNSRWQAWQQIQVSGFYEGRAPLRIGAWQTRFRLEARVGTGGASNNAGSGYVGNGASLTNGSLSGGLGASLRLPLSASMGPQPRPFVGLGLDYSVLWGFGDNGTSIYGQGWNERILTVPLVAGVTFQTRHLTLSPELRYAFLGSSSSNLYLSGAGGAMQNTVPTMWGLLVDVSWR